MKAPVAHDRRVTSIDALRGLAVLGILFVNIQYFAMGIDFNPPSPGPADTFVRAIVAILAEAKFISIFSLLFGAGIVLMDRSATRRNEKWTGRFLIRSGVLLAIGFLHAYLL